MARMVKDTGTVTDFLLYFDKEDFNKIYYDAESLSKILMIVSLFVFLLSPMLALTLVLIGFFIFYKKISRKLFKHQQLYYKYKNMFAPKMDEEVVTVVGYKVENEELEQHLNIVSNTKELAKKQQTYQNPNYKYKWVGFGHDTLKTHLMIIGKTGSGKTEAVRSIYQDILKIGGGGIFNDGKSDEKMLNEFYCQCADLNRETSFRVLNYLKPEEMSETNTLNPIALMHPLRAVEFMASLTNSASNGDANYQHFQNMGKVMLSCPVSCLSVRRDLYGEEFDFERVRVSTSAANFVIMYCLFYGMARDIDTIIKENESLQIMLATHKVSGIKEEFRHLVTLIDYVTQHPLEKRKVEQALGIKYTIIKEIYNNSFWATEQYLYELWAGYKKYLDHIASFLYYAVKKDDKDFFTLNEKKRGIGYDTFVYSYYYKIKEYVASGDKSFQDIIIEIQQKFPDVEITPMQMNLIKEGWTREKMRGGNVEDLPDDAIQQHQYALQIWRTLFQVFGMYKHIFGVTKSEINPKNLLLNNQILYNLIPVTELSEDVIQIIGKISLAIIQEVAGLALGGKQLSVHETLKRIAKDKFTPKPLVSVFLDEYNSYPIKGVDKMLLQYRSLNISVMLGIQNVAGLKVGGTDETSKDNALSNTTKFILKVEDKDMVEWVKHMMADEEVLEQGYMRNYDDEFVKKDDTVNIKEKKAFNAEKLRDFANGFSVVFKGSTAENIVFLQTFYRGGKTRTVQLKHFMPFDFIKST